jgi:ABC-type glycerol-3-phosphate transport system substrate-binding protein
MKKILLIGLSVLFTWFLVACEQDEPENDDIVITYAGWNLGDIEANNLERRLLNAFEDANPGVRVDIIERPKIPSSDDPESQVDMNWDEMLASLAATGKLPDVYMYATVPTAVINGWAEDMTLYMENDPELLNISQDIATAAVYGGKYFGIPQSNFYFGYFVNQTIFDNSNETRPTFGIEFDDLLELAESVSTYNLDGNSILGFQGVDRFFEWLPSQYNASLGWYTFDGQSFNLNSDAFSDAMAFQQQFYADNASTLFPYVWESSKVSDKVAWYSEGTGTQWSKGRHAVRWGGTFDLGWMIPEILNEENGIYGHEIDFIGTPVVVEGVQRIPVVLDYLIVGEGTTQPQLAYDLAKWMGFGKEGYLKRIEIASAFPESGSINFAPLQQDQDLLDAYFSLFPAGSFEEFKKVLAHDSFIIEGLKTVPGYVQARWTGTYGTVGGVSYTIATILDAIRDNVVQLADVKVALNDRINLMYQQAKTELNNRIR